MGRIHATEILDGILSLFETELKTPLSLQGIYRGDLAWLPPTDLTTMVNGIWVTLTGQTQIEESDMPRGILVTYPVRIILVRRIDATNTANPIKQKMDDADTITEEIYDNFRMTGVVTLESGSEILWWLPRTIEWEPPEDNLVATISSDLMAVAIGTEIMVRARI